MRIFTNWRAAYVIAGALAIAAPANAVPVLDQQNLVQGGNVGYGPPDLTRAQSFTVGIDGTLSEIQLFMNKSSAIATGNATLTIYDTDSSGAPDSVLATTSVDASAIGTALSFVSFDLSAAALQVSVGQVLAAGIAADFGGGVNATLLFPSGDTYLGGNVWSCGPSLSITCWTDDSAFNVGDFVFQTFVDAPEPATLAIFGFGLAGLGLAARRQRA